jgi:hypothetical protein
VTRPKSPMHDPPHTSETAHDQPVDEHAVAVRSAARAPSYLNPMTIREKLARHNSEILSLRETLDVAFAKGARGSKAREDRVIFPLLVACRDIVEEILFAVSEGFGRLALRSVRTMYECVVFARYLNLHPEKTDDYMATFHAQWAKVLENIPDPSTTMPEVHNVVAARIPAYAAGKHVDLDWSDKSTLKMANEAGIPNQFHAWAFNYASGFVHPSGVFFVRHLSQGPGEVFEVSTRPQNHEATFALRISHSLILNALDLRLKYAPSTSLQEGVERCKKDFVKIWGYPSPI